MIRDMFADRLLLFVSCFALIITMCFVAMILMDLNDLWKELVKYQQRIENLETLIMIHNNVISKVGCGV
jgi:predicted metalloprotease